MARQFYDGYPKCYDKPNILDESFCDKKDNCLCDKQNNNFLSGFNLDSIFNNFNIDDIILLAIALVLLHDGTDDTLLLIIIGVIFLVGLT